MKRCCVWFILACLAAPLAAAQANSDLPAPRAPKRVRITRVEQLLPNARILVRRPYHWSVTAHYGLGLKEGEKLLIVGSAIEPLVVQAIAMAAEEMGVTTDVVTRNIAPLAPANGARRAGLRKIQSQYLSGIPRHHLSRRSRLAHGHGG